MKGRVFMKKIIALLLTVVSIVSMAATTFAAEPEPTYTLTIEKSASGHTYEAYQIFSGELAQIDNKDILSNIKWGSAVTDSTTFLNKIKAESGLASLHSATNAAQLAEGLEKLKDKSEVLDLFAKTIGSELGKAAGTSTESQTEYTITGLKAGYYLVKDQDGTQEGKNDSYTKFILHVVKDQRISPKGSIPKVEKKINDTLDGDYKEVEDFNISDTVYYKWNGSLPGNLKDYNTYYYKFVDTLPVGISFEQIEQIYIANDTGACVREIYNRSTHGTDIPQISGAAINLKHTKGDYEYDKDGKVTGVNVAETVELEFVNLKGLEYELDSQMQIVVKYSATVDQNALIKTDMENAVKLVFDNNPSGQGHGETIPDEAHAFTFQISVDKFDKKKDSKKLKDAEFVLYYETNSGNSVTKHYAQVVTSEMIKNKEKINGQNVVSANLGNVYGYTTDKSKATVLTTDKKGYFKVAGLAAGTYYLEETKAPAGYNLMEDPVKVQIIPAYSKNNKDVTIKYVVNDKEQTSEVIRISNAAGATLPSTGGMGTVMFYIVGMVMLLISAYAFMARKRMNTKK